MRKRQRHRNERMARDKRHPESSQPAKDFLKAKRNQSLQERRDELVNEEKLLEGQEQPKAKAKRTRHKIKSKNDDAKCDKDITRERAQVEPPA